MNIREVIQTCEENKLLSLSDKELRLFLKDNLEYKNFINNLYNPLFKNHVNQTHGDKLNKIYRAFKHSLGNREDIKLFVLEQLIDKEGEVSPSRLGLLIKINPEIKNKILEVTSTYPEKMSLVGRCELIRKDIKEFPLCPICGKQVSWFNACHLNYYCSLKCQANDSKVKDMREQTMLERHGVKNNLLRKGDEVRPCEQTCLKKYGVKNTGGLGFVKEKREKTIFLKYGIKHIWSLKGEARKLLQDKVLKTVRERYNVDNVAQVLEFHDKSRKSSLTKHKYKDTEIYYQGSYEKYFLECIEEKGLLNEVKRPKGIKYIFNGKEKMYFPDFKIGNTLIEIKSTWTYDECGKNLEKRLKNEAKWKEARKTNEVIVLFTKKQIKEFILLDKFSLLQHL